MVRVGREGARARGPRRRIAAACLAALITLAPAAVAGAAAPPRSPAVALSPACRVPAAYFGRPFPLPRVRHLLAHRRPVRVLVVGPRFVGPILRPRAVNHLSRELARWLPHGRFIVMEDDEAVGPAADVFARLQDEVLDQPPDLVVWQVGTWDAIAGSEPDALAGTLFAAVHWLRRHDVDLVVVDPPFVPQVSHESIYWPIIATIGRVTERTHVNLLRWYAMLQYWDIGNRRGVARRETLAAKQPCMAELLGFMIARAAM